MAWGDIFTLSAVREAAAPVLGVTLLLLVIKKNVHVTFPEVLLREGKKHAVGGRCSNCMCLLSCVSPPSGSRLATRCYVRCLVPGSHPCRCAVAKPAGRRFLATILRYPQWWKVLRQRRIVYLMTDPPSGWLTSMAQESSGQCAALWRPRTYSGHHRLPPRYQIPISAIVEHRGASRPSAPRPLIAHSGIFLTGRCERCRFFFFSIFFFFSVPASYSSWLAENDFEYKS